MVGREGEKAGSCAFFSRRSASVLPGGSCHGVLRENQITQVDQRLTRVPMGGRGSGEPWAVATIRALDRLATRYPTQVRPNPDSRTKRAGKSAQGLAQGLKRRTGARAHLAAGFPGGMGRGRHNKGR